MNYSPPQHVEIRFRPTYLELANAALYFQYQAAEQELINSREGSEYVRRKIAELELDTKLKCLTSLPTNWDSCGSDRPSREAISSAAGIAKAFIDFGLVPDAITPSPEGGIAICFMRNQKYADIECLNSGEILAVRYSSNDDPKAWALERDAVATDATVQSFSQYLSA